VGNLLSLYPKIHRLRADSKEDCGLPNREWDFICNGSGGLCAPAADIEGEAFRIHVFLYGLLWFFSNEPACETKTRVCNVLKLKLLIVRDYASDLRRGRNVVPCPQFSRTLALSVVRQ
jgi:hypothetical protein